MVFFNYALRKLNAKIVYYGPGLCGKTTNLQWIHDHFEGGQRGKMITLSTEGDRTIFFDLLPIDIGTIRGMEVTLQLYTVPGQVHYNSTRQLVLRGADGVVFVADSQRTMRSSNIDSWRNLEENLALQGVELRSFPHVHQFNKRDLDDLIDIEDLDAELNHYSVPFFESIATEGVGAQETLEGIVKLVMRNLRERYEPVVAAGSVQSGEGPGLLDVELPTPATAGPQETPIASPPVEPVVPPAAPIAEVPDFRSQTIEVDRGQDDVPTAVYRELRHEEEAGFPDFVAAAEEAPDEFSGPEVPPSEEAMRVGDDPTDAREPPAEEGPEPAWYEPPEFQDEPEAEDEAARGGDIVMPFADKESTTSVVLTEEDRIEEPGPSLVEPVVEEAEPREESDVQVFDPPLMVDEVTPKPYSVEESVFDSPFIRRSQEGAPEEGPDAEVDEVAAAPLESAQESAADEQREEVEGVGEAADEPAEEAAPPEPVEEPVEKIPRVSRVRATVEDLVASVLGTRGKWSREPAVAEEPPPKEPDEEAVRVEEGEPEVAAVEVGEVALVEPADAEALEAAAPDAGEEEGAVPDEAPEVDKAEVVASDDDGVGEAEQEAPDEGLDEEMTAAEEALGAQESWDPDAAAKVVEAWGEEVSGYADRPGSYVIGEPDDRHGLGAPRGDEPPADEPRGVAKEPEPESPGEKPGDAELFKDDDFGEGLTGTAEAIPEETQAPPAIADEEALFEDDRPIVDPEAVEEPPDVEVERPQAEPITVGEGEPFAEAMEEAVPEQQVSGPQVLPPATVGGEAALVRAGDNQLHLRLQGTGAIAESGQVRALDIEVPVPGSWVGNRRVTLQLRLTLSPVPEDEDGGPGDTS
jgi:signal recognition particle receptor subunit beta